MADNSDTGGPSQDNDMEIDPAAKGDHNRATPPPSSPEPSDSESSSDEDEEV
jgi:hypothetical protein